MCSSACFCQPSPSLQVTDAYPSGQRCPVRGRVARVGVIPTSKNDKGSLINWRLIPVRYPPVISPGPFTLPCLTGPDRCSSPVRTLTEWSCPGVTYTTKKIKEAGETDGAYSIQVIEGHLRRTSVFPRLWEGLHEECLGELRLSSMGMGI
jgi:hypothetical protein